MDRQLHRYITTLIRDAHLRRHWHGTLPLRTQLLLFDEPCIDTARRLEAEAAALEADARSIS